jgi:hypothetical protein
MSNGRSEMMSDLRKVFEALELDDWAPLLLSIDQRIEIYSLVTDIFNAQSKEKSELVDKYNDLVEKINSILAPGTGR